MGRSAADAESEKGDTVDAKSGSAIRTGGRAPSRCDVLKPRLLAVVIFFSYYWNYREAAMNGKSIISGKGFRCWENLNLEMCLPADSPIFDFFITGYFGLSSQSS
jgi:hypothetical protein